MNGLSGAYSQILINGRPIFSPLVGLYGLEQIPTNMISRIEVVKGAGSALYGSSAIGGTVNVITKTPRQSSFSVNSSTQLTGISAPDVILSGNANMVHKDKRKGISLFFNLRDRQAYDHNNDNFSELPEVHAAAIGLTGFFLPKEGQKVELSFSSLNEYRYGGELGMSEPYLAGQAEERVHNVFIGSADYQINFNDDKSAVISYLSAQATARKHFTGVQPDTDAELQDYKENPPFGNSLNHTIQGGIQLDHRIDALPGSRNVVTLGLEYLHDDVLDEIPAYDFLIDQTTANLGAFFQHHWTISNRFTLVSGLRLDQHNMLDRLAFNPRISLLYSPQPSLQLRATYGSGFRAPQAFDTDMHIAFAAGGVSRIRLDPRLVQENSNSYSFSINYDKSSSKWIAGFTLEAFYTDLQDAFYLQPIGEDQFGLQFEKRNGGGSYVGGITLEQRANLGNKSSLQGSFTWQRSAFRSAVQVMNSQAPISDFLRTPNQYGSLKYDWTPNKKWNITTTGNFTGSMLAAHFAGAPEQENDEIINTERFFELSFRINRTFRLKRPKLGLNTYLGIKNIFNAYQSDFDSGKNRDSNYIYGPSLPRSVYFGISIDREY